ncbi:hypothetical protein M011DRAFT_526699 [Sporormia fimetaria CBS 119925]|uniref:Carbohydrate kinase PfkB domain-containing protein n=1 Tax=Sporormia fimetaria CBS 119925 TaxID=1340428 RepID=A0A6A6V8Q4_9PLEO|nr:hypothetical protein M011DRAFT_526699 [Sporormia fimetaria CBS 119925]
MFRGVRVHTLRTSSSRPLSRLLTTGRRHLSNNAFFRVSEEVREALHSKKPVVALETTIYTHGFPYPENVALASLLESVVRVNGGIPATIGIIDGIARVGLTPEELIMLASSAGKENTLKLSRRDLSYVAGMRLAGKNFNGGTTIAGTMLLAHLAGIKIFGTGGLGGVHRGAESSMDISADLTELGRTPVTVVSSGCKSFLDIPRTLEYLETEGVGVGTFADGREGKVDFPAFWSRDSGVKSPTTIQDEKEAAAIICESHGNIIHIRSSHKADAQNAMQIQSGLLFANPVPTEAAIPKTTMDTIIEEAIRQANVSGASGKDNTPFILAKVKELSKGASIPANRALIESNVRRATIVARELAVLEVQQEEAEGQSSSYILPVQSSPAASAEQLLHNASLEQPPQTPSTQEDVDILVAGALAVDISCDYTPLPTSISQLDPAPHTSNPATITQTLGGVAHNIAKAAHFLGSPVRLCSAIGSDLSGRAALSALESSGMQTSGIQTLPSPAKTSQYVAVNNAHKDLTTAMADMSILESINPETIETTWFPSLPHFKTLITDANWLPPALSSWLRFSKSRGAFTIFEPVSTAKSTRLLSALSSPSSSSTTQSTTAAIFPNHLIDLATPNNHELTALHTHASSSSLFSSEHWFRTIDALGIPSTGLRVPLSYTTSPALVDAGVPQRAIQLLPFIPTILTKLGPGGVLLTCILPFDDPALNSADEAKYVLARNGNGDREAGVGGLYVRLFEVEEVLKEEQVVSVNGIGDTFLGALAVGLQRGGKMEEVVRLAQRAAGLSLRSVESVAPELRGLRGEVEKLGR